MRTTRWMLVGVVCGLIATHFQASCAQAADAYPVITDVNAGPQIFGASAGVFGGFYALNSAASLDGNAVLAINQNGNIACCHGALIEVSISNGENGVDSTENGANVDVPNNVLPNPVFDAIGNESDKLENGNVIRFSAWFRSDPANPITLDPQVQPILKIEYWKEALSGNADSNGTQVAPQFGDRVFDQDQQGSAIGIPDLPQWIDLNNDGMVLDATATLANGRVSQISTSEWRLVEVTHEVNSAVWYGIGAEAFGADDVRMIESVKAVMFMGNFESRNLTLDGPDGGNLLVDNVLVEVFKDVSTVTPNANPNPSAAPGLIGDYNDDGNVDAADYVTWRNNEGTGNTLPNDPVGGTIGAAQYTNWAANFGMMQSGSGGGANAVPEPASLVLLALAATCAWLTRREKRFK